MEVGGLRNSKAEAAETLAEVRSVEGEKVEKLEQQLQSERQKGQELLEKIQTEARSTQILSKSFQSPLLEHGNQAEARQGEVQRCQIAAEKRCNDIELVANARFESVRLRALALNKKP